MSNKVQVRIVLGIFAIFLLVGIWSIAQYILDKYYLSKEVHYSITIGYRPGPVSRNGVPSTRYIFPVGSEKYVGDVSLYIAPEEHYFVKFYPPDPDRNDIISVKATEDDIKNLPPDGYKTLPHH